MKKKGLLISIILLLIVSVSLFFLLNNKNDNYKYDEKVISNKFEYEQAVTNESIEDTYYYSDSYFKNSSILENEHLRSFAFVLASAFNPTYRKEVVTSNLDKIFNELDFNDIEYYDIEGFGKDTIGTSISHKKLNEKYDLVVIVLRGASYKDEWESNFDLGKDGDAKGFNDASLIVLERLNKYLNDYKIKDYKLLMTGYSRAGAVSGLTGVHINKELDRFNIGKENLYVYSFESPRYSIDNTIYDNIHNVINKNDIITYFYPETWGFYHSGKNEEITTDKSELDEYYLDILSNEKIKKFDTTDKERFLQMFINILPKERSKYNEIYDSILNIYSLINSKSPSEKETIINFLKDNKINFDLSNSITLLSLINSTDKKTLRNNFDIIMSSYDSEYSKIKNVISEQEYNLLKDSIFNIFLYLQPTIQSEYKSNHMFSIILTFSNNLEELFKEHYFSTNFEQIKKKDSYYKNA